MRIEIVNDEDIDIFINAYQFKGINLKDKETLLNEIKDILIKIDTRYRLNLNGFYKIKVYPKPKIGVFLNIIKIDDNEFNQEADFRITIYQNEPFLFETEEYEILPKNISKRYYKDKFYVDVEDIEDIIPIMDMGNIVYGPSAKKIIQTSKTIK